MTKGATIHCASILFAVSAAMLCASCASRPESGYLTPVAASAEGARDHTLLIASTRSHDPRPGTLYNGHRASLSYASVTVSVPAGHVAGAIEWPTTAPGNPQTDFVVRREELIDDDAGFLRQLNAQLAAQPPGNRKVLLFVHGYNTMFAEALYRFTQVVQDSRSPAAPVLFTWASRGQLAQYVYDTNSATIARDALEHTIRLLFASDADQINILAHSMGNWVTIEAMRQIKMSDRLPHPSKLGQVILAAPDIDVDVFKSEMRTFGKPRKPFYIVLSKDDRALAVSNFIAGGRSRLGADSDVAELAAMGAIVIDLSNLAADDPSNHDKFAQLAAVAPELAAILAKGIGDNSNAIEGGREAIGGGFGTLVATPLTLLGAPIAIIGER